VGSLITSKVLDVRRRKAYGPEGGEIEGNDADDALMVNQGEW
jgi:hypothetical protein